MTPRRIGGIVSHHGAIKKPDEPTKIMTLRAKFAWTREKRRST
jgi:hypothetical protein